MANTAADQRLNCSPEGIEGLTRGSGKLWSCDTCLVEEQVREYSVKSAALREAKAELTEAISGSEELEAEVQSLWEEMSTQRTIVDKCDPVLLTL